MAPHGARQGLFDRVPQRRADVVVCDFRNRFFEERTDQEIARFSFGNAAGANAFVSVGWITA